MQNWLSNPMLRLRMIEAVHFFVVCLHGVHRVDFTFYLYVCTLFVDAVHIYLNITEWWGDSPVSCYFLPVRPTDLSQHPVCRHSKSICFLQCCYKMYTVPSFLNLEYCYYVENNMYFILTYLKNLKNVSLNP
jgi:hypothetical protein